ncbi:carboxypeptidase-like protein S1 [Myriangium duriaei CBS 260.36]|uniref:Carboxypeptidase n=1 Tax=Myriangium duriaei CBS 260.36 TaxID=1168546 RepID=A0A9P4J7F9_9PEZI|nr:carboxypeptidase-like protein S1 [Myriangium duriaei CBS 260.36]
MLTKFLTAALALGGSLVAASPILKDKRSFVERDGTNFTVFEHAATGAKLEFVTNSGICETTPGVNQYSGYLSVGTNMNMWFWFFEARNSPTTAPLATWFNGGPGCSSMIGLFQENGPCHFVNGASTPSLNPYSWNTYANMLYIDQPIGVGFSYGSDPVTSTVTAAPYVWKLLQAFFTQFPQYENHDFGIFTESYGGHYGPEFAAYFESQNSAISSGSATGTHVNLVALGVNNGWFDPTIQYQAYIDYSYNNSYNQLIDASDRQSYTQTMQQSCAPALTQCTSLTGSNSACANAQSVCYQDIEGPLSQAGNFDVYDVREPSNDPYPPSTYQTYLTSSAVTKKIGAKSTYTECSDSAGQGFSQTGDNSRSLLSTLGSVVSSGIQVLVWAGDADWICNYLGGFNVANAVKWSSQSAFQNTALKSYTVSGKAGGLFKTVKNFSWLQVYGAGHEVPYYQPEVALQAFKQTMGKQGLSST